MLPTFNPSQSTNLEIINRHYLSERADGRLEVGSLRTPGRRLWVKMLKWRFISDQRIEVVNDNLRQWVSDQAKVGRYTIQQCICLLGNIRYFKRRIVDTHNLSRATYILSWIFFFRQVHVTEIEEHRMGWLRTRINAEIARLAGGIQNAVPLAKLNAIEETLTFYRDARFLDSDPAVIDITRQAREELYQNALNALRGVLQGLGDPSLFPLLERIMPKVVDQTAPIVNEYASWRKTYLQAKSEVDRARASLPSVMQHLNLNSLDQLANFQPQAEQTFNLSPLARKVDGELLERGKRWAQFYNEMQIWFVKAKEVCLSIRQSNGVNLPALETKVQELQLSATQSMDSFKDIQSDFAIPRLLCSTLNDEIDAWKRKQEDEAREIELNRKLQQNAKDFDESLEKINTDYQTRMAAIKEIRQKKAADIKQKNAQLDALAKQNAEEVRASSQKLAHDQQANISEYERREQKIDTEWQESRKREAHKTPEELN